MSSATPKYPDAFRAGVQKTDQAMAKIMRLGLSPRQQDLNRAWAYYCAEQYDECKIGWNGREVLDDLTHETVSRSGVIPPGFYNANGFDEMPLEFRRPRAPYHAVRVVVNRFSGLLFSSRMHPKPTVTADPLLQKFVEDIAKASRLWVKWATARKYGGAMGSVAVTFRFKDGRPIVEVHDPRWCDVTFRDRATGEVEMIEIRYMYPEEVRRPDGVLEEQWFWYRRVIDEVCDVTYKPAPVGDGEEPVWEVDEMVNHLLDEFPGVWVRNTDTDALDGEADCHGVYDTSDEIDQLKSQASQGALENADPTLHIASDAEIDGTIKKGSRNAIKTGEKGQLGYVEVTGAGIKLALEVANDLRRDLLEVVQCMLDNDAEDKSAPMTATEVERRYSSMHDRGDLFREQYGECGVKPLLEKMVRAIVKLSTGMVINGEVTNFTFAIPGEIAEIAQRIAVTPIQIDLVWPPWVKRGPTDALAAAQAVAAARTAQALDQESAVGYAAPYFDVEDVGAALVRVQGEAAQQQDALTAGILAQSQGGTPEPPRRPPRAPGSPPTKGAPGEPTAKPSAFGGGKGAGPHGPAAGVDPNTDL